MTTREWLSAWDAGDSVWSVDMGGMGPSYEQAIQTLMVEMVRDSNCELTTDELAMADPEPSVEKETRWNCWHDDTIKRLNGLPWGGFSGAQVGAAKTLAFLILRDGPDGVKDSLRKQGIDDRLIQISNDWHHP